VNYLNPKFANLPFSALLKLAQPRSTSSPSGLSAEALLNNAAKISATDPPLKSISFGRPSRRTTTVPSGSSGSGILASAASSLFGGSLIGSLASLFRSSNGQTTQTLSLFQLPESTRATLVTGGSSGSPQSLNLSALKGPAGSNTGGSIRGTLMPSSTHAQNNLSRTYSAGNQGIPKGMAPSVSGGSSTASGHQIHIHVSALDTQSFLDRSSHIAQAVKTAMLQSNSLNDVIAEM
jgi:hypothetical protein